MKDSQIMVHPEDPKQGHSLGFFRYRGCLMSTAELHGNNEVNHSGGTTIPEANPQVGKGGGTHDLKRQCV